MSEHKRFHSGRNKARQRLLKFTRKAFRMLPQVDRPRILDIGCGSGIPTLELARLSQGDVIGIDIDQSALDEFNEKIKIYGLTHRIRAINCSMVDMDFPDRSFDIIWSEGSIFAIGFEKGLREWKPLLRPNGFMVIHDEQGSIKRKLKQISNCSYELLGYFILSKEIWRDEYFTPLEKWITESGTRYISDPRILEEFHQTRIELDTFKDNPELSSSVYFILKGN